jgi:hypothetical protein
MDRIFLAVITSGLLVLGTAVAVLVAYRNDKAVSLIQTPPVKSMPAKIPPPADDHSSAATTGTRPMKGER